VYETLDFMVRYLEDYQVRGIPQLEELAADVRRRSQATLADLERQRADTQALQISGQRRESILRGQRDHEAAVRLILSEWEAFMDEKAELATSIRSKVAAQLAILRVRRAGARTRIEVLGLAAVTNLINESISDLEQATLEAVDLDLAPLPLDRMHRLLGITDLSRTDQG